MDWQATTLWPTLRPLSFGLVRTPPDQRDPAARWFALAIARPDLPALARWYERLTERDARHSHVMQPLT